MRSASTTPGWWSKRDRSARRRRKPRRWSRLRRGGSTREPVARIVGGKEFWGLPLRVTGATLVPRPETETVVEAALAAIDDGGPRTPRAAHRRSRHRLGRAAARAAAPNCRTRPASAPTSAPTALAVARDNAGALGLARARAFRRVRFRRGAGAAVRPRRVATRPTSRAATSRGLRPRSAHDPRRALDGGADGLAAYRTIAGQATGCSTPHGHLVVELGIGQEAAVAALFRAAGLAAAPRPCRSCRYSARAACACGRNNAMIN